MLNPEQIAAFLTGKIKHARYAEAVSVREKLVIHTRGEFPAEILDTTRPNEEEVHKLYRKQVFEPITKSKAGKVITQTAKIQRSRGFGMEFPRDLKAPSLIRKEEGLSEYLEKNFPVYDSVMAFLFQNLVRASFEDPNGVVVMHPMEYETEKSAANIQEGQYLKPFPYIFTSEELLDYSEGEYAVILKEEKVSYQYKGETQNDGNEILIVDTVNYYFFTQIGKDKNGNAIYNQRTYAHNLQGKHKFPVWQLGSNDIEKRYTGYNLYNSFLTPCLPNWRQAIRSFSDHQVNQVMHIHPEKWYKTSTECKVCNGKGKVSEQKNTKTIQAACPNKCSNGFVIKVSPMAPIIMAPYKSAVNEAPQFFNGDPAGYIAKPTNDMQFIKDEYKDQLVQGLDAIGLGYIEETQLNQSGKAKELDRQEINTFFYGVASLLAKSHLYNIVFFTNELRYSFVDQKQRETYFNAITFSVPEQFDVVGSDYYYSQYVNAQTNKDDAEIVASKALEYARIEFGEDSLQYKMMQAKYDLDPLPGLSPEQKIEYRASGECTPEDFVISNQLYSFLKRAISENKDFFEKTYKEKADLLNSYATEKLQTSVSRKLEQPPMFATKTAS